MSKTVNVNFRLDEDVKKEMEAVCAGIGITMSTAFTIYAKKVAREKRIPFELSLNPDTFYSESNIRHLEEVAARINAGTAKLIEHDLIEVE